MSRMSIDPALKAAKILLQPNIYANSFKNIQQSLDDYVDSESDMDYLRALSKIPYYQQIIQNALDETNFRYGNLKHECDSIQNWVRVIGIQKETFDRGYDENEDKSDIPPASDSLLTVQANVIKIRAIEQQFLEMLHSAIDTKDSATSIHLTNVFAAAHKDRSSRETVLQQVSNNLDSATYKLRSAQSEASRLEADEKHLDVLMLTFRHQEVDQVTQVNRLKTATAEWNKRKTQMLNELDDVQDELDVYRHAQASEAKLNRDIASSEHAISEYMEEANERVRQIESEIAQSKRTSDQELESLNNDLKHKRAATLAAEKTESALILKRTKLQQEKDLPRFKKSRMESVKALEKTIKKSADVDTGIAHLEADYSVHRKLVDVALKHALAELEHSLAQMQELDSVDFDQAISDRRREMADEMSHLITRKERAIQGAADLTIEISATDEQAHKIEGLVEEFADHYANVLNSNSSLSYSVGLENDERARVLDQAKAEIKGIEVTTSKIATAVASYMTCLQRLMDPPNAPLFTKKLTRSNSFSGSHSTPESFRPKPKPPQKPKSQLATHSPSKYPKKWSTYSDHEGDAPITVKARGVPQEVTLQIDIDFSEPASDEQLDSSRHSSSSRRSYQSDIPDEVCEEEEEDLPLADSDADSFGNSTRSSTRSLPSDDPDSIGQSSSKSRKSRSSSIRSLQSKSSTGEEIEEEEDIAASLSDRAISEHSEPTALEEDFAEEEAAKEEEEEGTEEESAENKSVEEEPPEEDTAEEETHLSSETKSIHSLPSALSEEEDTLSGGQMTSSTITAEEDVAQSSHSDQGIPDEIEPQQHADDVWQNEILLDQPDDGVPFETHQAETVDTPQDQPDDDMSSQQEEEQARSAKLLLEGEEEASSLGQYTSEGAPSDHEEAAHNVLIDIQVPTDESGPESSARSIPSAHSDAEEEYNSHVSEQVPEEEYESSGPAGDRISSRRSHRPDEVMSDDEEPTFLSGRLSRRPSSPVEHIGPVLAPFPKNVHYLLPKISFPPRRNSVVVFATTPKLVEPVVRTEISKFESVELVTMFAPPDRQVAEPEQIDSHTVYVPPRRRFRRKRGALIPSLQATDSPFDTQSQLDFEDSAAGSRGLRTRWNGRILYIYPIIRKPNKGPRLSYQAKFDFTGKL